MVASSNFLTSYPAWLPAIFLAAGTGLAILALILFLRFRLAGVIKGWLFHHGFWKNREAKESRRLMAQDADKKEEYRQEISRLFSTSGMDSGRLRKEARGQDKTWKKTAPKPDPEGSEETTLLGQGEKGRPFAAENQDRGNDGPETASHPRNNNTATGEGRGMAANTGPAPDPRLAGDSDRPGAAALPTGPEISDGGEPTTLLEKTDSFDKERPAAVPVQPELPGGEDTVSALTEAALPDGEEPTALLIRPELSDGEETTELLTRTTREGRPEEKTPSGDIPDFKITKKEILIHTDERI